MALFDDIKKKVTDSTQSAVKATKELAETSKLNSQISDEQRKIASLYSEVGKQYFAEYGATSGGPLDELCAQIIAANEQIANLQAEIQVIKGVKTCPTCGAELPVTSGFCGKCGTAVETPVVAEPEPEIEPAAEAEVEPQPRFCSNCGTELEDGAMFCGNCGTKQE